MAKISFTPPEVPISEPQAEPVEAPAPQGYTPVFNAEKASNMSALIKAITNFDSSVFDEVVKEQKEPSEISKKFEKLLKVFTNAN